METQTAFPLSMTEEGQTVSIVNIMASMGLKTRLTSFGLLPKSRITVIRNSASGPFVIRIKNTRMALGRQVAEKIMVMNQ
jgi:ferrous iron transport protein A